MANALRREHLPVVDAGEGVEITCTSFGLPTRTAGDLFDFPCYREGRDLAGQPCRRVVGHLIVPMSEVPDAVMMVTEALARCGRPIEANNDEIRMLDA